MFLRPPTLERKASGRPHTEQRRDQRDGHTIIRGVAVAQGGGCVHTLRHVAALFLQGVQRKRLQLFKASFSAHTLSLLHGLCLLKVHPPTRSTTAVRM